MPKFLVTTIGTVRYTAQLFLDAPSEVEAEALALNIMPSISANTCDDDGDLTNVEVNEVEEVTDDQPETTSYLHTVHASAKVGSETFSVISWSCQHDEYRVCITLSPSREHPDGYVYEKGKFRDLGDAIDSFQMFVSRARQASR